MTAHDIIALKNTRFSCHMKPVFVEGDSTVPYMWIHWGRGSPLLQGRHCLLRHQIAVRQTLLSRHHGFLPKGQVVVEAEKKRINYFFITPNNISTSMTCETQKFNVEITRTFSFFFAVFPFLFYIFMLLVNLWFIRLQELFPILRVVSHPLSPTRKKFN